MKHELFIKRLIGPETLMFENMRIMMLQATLCCYMGSTGLQVMAVRSFVS
jgi:hypothetical protein